VRGEQRHEEHPRIPGRGSQPFLPLRMAASSWSITPGARRPR
jgi:hypothetical protein